MKKNITEQEALQRLTGLCATAEHCSQEMLEKLQKWEIPADAQARIMQHLINNKYIDEERYCRAFVNDKIRYSKWGRRKIEQALFMKHIDKAIQRQVLDAVDPEEYVTILRPMLQQKRKSTKAANTYELNRKLLRFAMQRGFTIDIIRQCLEVDDEADW